MYQYIYISVNIYRTVNLKSVLKTVLVVSDSVIVNRMRYKGIGVPIA